MEPVEQEEQHLQGKGIEQIMQWNRNIKPHFFTLLSCFHAFKDICVLISLLLSLILNFSRDEKAN